MKTILVCFGAAVLLGVATPVCEGGAATTGSAVAAELDSIKVAELGAWAARRVGAVSEAGPRAALAGEVVVAVAERYPTATGLVVGSLARFDAELAAVAAGAATKGQPEKVFTFVAAAAEAAPGQVRAIVAAVSRQAPKHFRGIGVLAARLVPGSADRVLAGLSDGVPALEGLLLRARSEMAGTGSALEAGEVLARVDLWLASAARSMKVPSTALLVQGDTRLAQFSPPPGAPVVTPPFHPLPGIPSFEYPILTESVPPGGRDYAKP